MALKIKVILVCKLGWILLIWGFFCNATLFWFFSKMPLKLQVNGIFVGISCDSVTRYLDKGVYSVIQLARLYLTKVRFTLLCTKKIIILHL